MGFAQKKTDTLTIEAWLALEQETGVRYEYHLGEVFAMAGGTLDHTRIGKNTTVELENHFVRSGKNCEAFPAELKVEISPKGRYVYPDTVAVCDEVENSEIVTGAIRNPILVVEVTSESSEAYDHGAKFRYYRRLSSLKEYLILEQAEPVATLYRRNGAGDIFTRHDFEGLDATLTLGSVDLEIPLGRLYRNVAFAKPD